MTDTKAADPRSAESTPQVQFRTTDGVRVRYADSGAVGTVVVITGPWPESLCAFAPSSMPPSS